MADLNVKDMLARKNEFISQTVKKRTTILAGTTEIVEISVPRGVNTFLQGYGYNWFASTTYKLYTGDFEHPSRTDQEGSLTQPIMFSTPFVIGSGKKVAFQITNASASNHDYDVVFYFVTDHILNEVSTGGELITATSTSGSIAGSVYLTNDAGTVSVDVVTDSLSVNRLAVDTELTVTDFRVGSTDNTEPHKTWLKTLSDGTLVDQVLTTTPTHTNPTVALTTTTVLASNANRKSALIQNISNEDVYINLGAPAVLSTGILLLANGGSYEMSYRYGNLTTVAINGICVSGGKTVLVTENV